MINRRVLLTFISTGVMSLGHGATLVLDTMSVPSIDNAVEVSYNQWLATSFISEETARPMLAANVSLRVNCVVPNENVFVGVVGAQNGRPDLSDVRAYAEMTPLKEEIPHSSTMVVNLQFVSDTRQELEPGSIFWLVFGSKAPDYDKSLPSGLYRWSYAASPVVPINQDGWKLSNTTATGNTLGQNWTIEENSPYTFSLSLVPVPEPTFLALSGLTLVFRRRRK